MEDDDSPTKNNTTESRQEQQPLNPYEDLGNNDLSGSMAQTLKGNANNIFGLDKTVKQASQSNDYSQFEDLDDDDDREDDDVMQDKRSDHDLENENSKENDDN